ncbi:hypothetical protein X798_03468 [Onchocerca flexuosa]|uniref:Uncharacterized protein n=1 Tax=Onchocerca flexuosa TaxID=387005 RepID=A0A238BW05_9BILA|nr:hypothetical protein X798_03468 [Onchocerca flexuosa]
MCDCHISTKFKPFSKTGCLKTKLIIVIETFKIDKTRVEVDTSKNSVADDDKSIAGRFLDFMRTDKLGNNIKLKIKMFVPEFNFIRNDIGMTKTPIHTSHNEKNYQLM